jgi:hypothetical protein
MLLVLLGAAPPSVAAPGTGPAAAPAEAEGWYGGPAVAIDAAAVGLLATGLAVKGWPGAGLAVVGVSTAVLVSPFNHALHGYRDRTDLSFGLRLGAALVGLAADLYVAGAYDRCSGETPSGYCGRLRGGLLLAPLAVVMVVDDAVLSRGSSRAEPSVTARLAPMVGPTGLLFGLGGTF